MRNGMPATGLTGAQRRKSSRSAPTGGNCAEVAFLPGALSTGSLGRWGPRAARRDPTAFSPP